MNASTYARGKISSEFHTGFGRADAAKKRITNQYKIERIIQNLRIYNSQEDFEIVGYWFSDVYKSK